MRVALLTKQVSRFEAMTFDQNGRVQREGLELQVNRYCRRSIANGADLLGRHRARAGCTRSEPPPLKMVCVRRSLGACRGHTRDGSGIREQRLACYGPCPRGRVAARGP